MHYKYPSHYENDKTNKLQSYVNIINSLIVNDRYGGTINNSSAMMHITRYFKTILLKILKANISITNKSIYKVAYFF